ncbi:MAG TPA: protein kinase [Gemmataceae bacterium]|nr:protein kinase [Gemmataceae bacterium]
MSASHRNSSLHRPGSLPLDPSIDWERIEGILDRFEEAWQRGERPSLKDYLSEAGGERRALLIELVHEDLEYRIGNGEAARVESYLERFPELHDDAPVMVELIASEFYLRRRVQGTCAVAEYLRRFPELSEVLSSRLQEADAALTTPAEAMSANATALETPKAGGKDTAEGPGGRETLDAARVPPARDRHAVPGYEIIAELGRGGMGVVYKAWQLKAKRAVALKMLLAHAHASLEEKVRFQIEAEAVARFQHPNLVQLYDIGEHDGLPFFSLEFCGGGSLDRDLKERRRMGQARAPREVAALVEKLARAMHYAHSHGVVHRDLKPGNILLTPEGEPKVADFGLAKRMDSDAEVTRTGMVMGSPPYMAPEQAAGALRDISPVSDVYALGAILYELLTGRPPFLGATSVETIRQVLNDEPAPPRRLNAAVPRDLEIICLKCLQKDQPKRYASAEALAEDLRRFANDEPISARPTPAWERALKWVRRRPTTAALVAVTAFALFAVVVLVVGWQSQQINQARQELKKFEEQDQVRQRGGRMLGEARRLEAEGRWATAYVELIRARDALEGLPGLHADALRQEVEQHLADVGRRREEQERRAQAEKHRAEFRAAHDKALFYVTLFTGLDPGDNRDKTRAAARDALAVYGLDDPAAASSGLEADRPYLTRDVYEPLVGACYELLLLWAEAEAGPPPGRAEPDGESPRRAENALALLARAESLGRAHGINTRTYHLRKARYLALRAGQKFDPARVDEAAPAAPTGALDWFLEGVERYTSRRYELAAAACHEVLRAQGKHFWARYVLALCHLRGSRWAEAKGELTICVAEMPEFAWPKLLRGFAESELGFNNDKKPQRTEEFEAAADDFEAALRQDNDPLVQYVGLVNRGVLDIRRGRWEQAVALLRKAVAADPSGFQGTIDLAEALQGWGKSDEALAALGQAIERAPKLGLLYEARGHLHLKGKDWAAARADFQKAIDLGPNEAAPERAAKDLVELGRLQYREWDYKGALKSYDKALSLKRDFVLAERFRAEALLALDRETEAGEALDRYLKERHEAPVEVYQARGLIYADKGKLPAAIEMYTLALRQYPDDGATHCYRGWAYLLADAPGLALDDFNACLARDGGNADALAGRGNVRIRLRQLDGALEDARAAEKQAPLTDRLLYNIARVYGQAVALLEAETRTAQPESSRLAAQRLAQCRERAFDFLGRALEKMPRERRAAFWRDQVQADPALAAIRHGSRYAELAARYGGAKP